MLAMAAETALMRHNIGNFLGDGNEKGFDRMSGYWPAAGCRRWRRGLLVRVAADVERRQRDGRQRQGPGGDRSGRSGDQQQVLVYCSSRRQVDAGAGAEPGG